jgi:death-on-curing protein
MQTQPVFLALEEILMLHQASLKRFGGSPGLRNEHLLRSALAQPEASFDGKFLREGLFEMAAAYLYHSIQNHPFIDGNKRRGLAAAIVFLHMNGYQLEAPPPAAVEFVLAVARGEQDKPAVAAFLRRYSRPGHE